jgi:hypothetical protein
VFISVRSEAFQLQLTKITFHAHILDMRIPGNLMETALLFGPYSLHPSQIFYESRLSRGISDFIVSKV